MFIDSLYLFGTPCQVYGEKTPRSGQQKRSFTCQVEKIVLKENRDLGNLIRRVRTEAHMTEGGHRARFVALWRV